ncbi:MAG: TonB-dependent receptor [Porticoccaceae bacterium]|nr:TonB-dependent receptor [Porticoccaceae bacterium]
MNQRICAALVLSALCSSNTVSNVLEEVIVTSSLVDQTLSDIENPLHVVSGEDISTNASQSLGESLDNLLGVSSTDYGAGVGQPIIRGMSGNRVKILSNGMVVRDVSGLGADHINDVDLNNIQQIEVVRGPSSLLYSNGTIGGIINVVDNTIARKDFSTSELKVGLEAQSVNDGDSHNVSYQNAIGGLNLSFAYKDSQFGDFDIPNGTMLHFEDEHDDHEEDEGHADEEQPGYLANSGYESTATRLGISKAGDWGYFGVSINRVKSLYGIPFHGEEQEGEEHEGERVFSTTDSEVLNLEGSYVVNSSWLKKVNYYLRDTDYSLTEQHAEGEGEHNDEVEEHGDELHEEGPTLFTNDAKEYGAIFDLTNGSLLQKVSVNFVEEDISIIGEEAFMNPTTSEEMTLGYFVSKELDLVHLDVGIRHDRIRRKGSVRHSENHQEVHEDELEDAEYFDRNIDNTSFAMSLGFDVDDNVSLNLSSAIVERAPSAVELFMNGPHLASGRFEVGNSGLKSERSKNVDLTLNYDKNGFFGVFTVFKNDVDNYIYLLDETEEEHTDHDEEHHDEGLILAKHLQKDAEFFGYEFEFGTTLTLKRGDLSLSFGRDSVLGEFSDKRNIPRITPSRNIYSIAYSEDNLELKLDLKDVQNQDDIGINETITSGFSMLDFNAVKTFSFGKKQTATVSLFAKNLLDEVARNHSSFVKDEVPLPGRNIGIKLQVTL